MPTSLFMVAGEQSGDMHGAALMEELLQRDPCLLFNGVGGTRMEAVANQNDSELQDWTANSGVVGLTDVLKKIFFFRKQLQLLLQRIEQKNPAAVVLIDFSGFNLRLAAAIRKKKLPVKIFYFISPQFWASRPKRLQKMAQLLDHVIVIFPFEKEMLEKAGIPVSFVGHPLVEKWKEDQEKNQFPRQEYLLGLFPGSRRSEVTKIAPPLLEAAKLLTQKHPEITPAMALVSQEHLSFVQAEAKKIGLTLNLSLGNATELMQRATFGWVCSGTATLQAATLGMPYALVYKVAWLTYEVGRRLIRIPYLGIVNFLARRQVVTELIQSELTAEKLVTVALPYFEDPQKGKQLSHELISITDPLSHHQSYSQAATTLLELLCT